MNRTSLALLIGGVFVVLMLAAIASFACADTQPPEGFTALFNGHDLAGWRGRLSGAAEGRGVAVYSVVLLLALIGLGAIAFGAEGVGLCRTEHMFFGEGKIGPMREMIVAENEADRGGEQRLDQNDGKHQAEQKRLLLARGAVTGRCIVGAVQHY